MNGDEKDYRVMSFFYSLCLFESHFSWRAGNIPDRRLKPVSITADKGYGISTEEYTIDCGYGSNNKTQNLISVQNLEFRRAKNVSNRLHGGSSNGRIYLALKLRGKEDSWRTSPISPVITKTCGFTIEELARRVSFTGFCCPKNTLVNILSPVYIPGWKIDSFRKTVKQKFQWDNSAYETALAIIASPTAV